MCVYTPLPLPVLAVLHILSLKILTYLYSQWTQTHDTVSIPNILAPPFQKLRLILLKHTATAFLSGTLYIESAVKAGIFPLYDDCTALDTVSSGLRTLPRCVVSRTLVTTRTSFQVLAKEVITGPKLGQSLLLLRNEDQSVSRGFWAGKERQTGDILGEGNESSSE